MFFRIPIAVEDWHSLKQLFHIKAGASHCQPVSMDKNIWLGLFYRCISKASYIAKRWMLEAHRIFPVFDATCEAMAGHGVAAAIFFFLCLLPSLVAAQHPKHTIGLFEICQKTFSSSRIQR
jgi:hypothetical protein